MAELEHLSGLVGEIRTSTQSNQYDLSGYTEMRARDLMAAAFSTPLNSPSEMIKCTFIVGGGKLVRSRYHDDLTKWVINALKDIGFTEDRSAAETFDSQGTFKQQHDTGQNLKYVIVFPHVSCATVNLKLGPISSEEGLDNSPESIVSTCEVATFKEIVLSKVQSFKQKKRLAKILQDFLKEIKLLEAKLISGQPLSTSEQKKYDSSPENIEEKIGWLQSEMNAMIDGGQLSQSEKTELINSLKSELDILEQDLNQAKLDKKMKKVEKLAVRKRSLEEKIAMVDKLSPMVHRLKYSEEIQRLRMSLFPLLALEEKSRSISLTMADLKTLEPKSDIENSIRDFELKSRGWFDDEEDFLEMCKYEEKEAKAKYLSRSSKQNGSVDKKKNTSSSSSFTQSKVISKGGTGSIVVGPTKVAGWSTVTNSKNTTTVASSNGKAKINNSFAAFDSDSDS